MLFKVTGERGAAFHGGSGHWPLPNGAPGAWMEVQGPLKSCKNGLHLCRKPDLVGWLGPVIWQAELEGEALVEPDKIVARRARLLRRCEGWTEQTARLFAADCAERVLLIADDPRCDAAVLAARRYSFGLIDASAMDAARDAAWNAAVDIRDTAWDAFGAAGAAGAAAWNAAVDKRVAAWAAKNAAEAAAQAADRDAWAAARAAAVDSARAAAVDSAEAWQTRRLFDYMEGRVNLDEIRASCQQELNS